MNKYIKIGLLLLFSNYLWAQGGIVNNNAKIQVSAGTEVKITVGGVSNQAGGEITNAGNIYLDQDWLQTGAATSYSGTGWMWFENGVNQNISSTSAITVPKLRVDNGDLLILGSTVNVSTQVDLLNGKIQLNANNLIINSGANVINYNAAKYIVTNGSGFLQQEVAGAAVVFPVGNAIYNPATLTNAGTTDNFQARVEDFVRGDYPAGNVETIGVVGKAWFIEEETIGGSDVTMTLQWETGDELPGFSRIVSGISHWTGAAWDRSPTWTAAATVGASWTQTRTGITSFSPFAVEDLDMELPVELLDFQARRTIATEVNLDWSTASELNNSGFELERRLDTENEFQKVAWIDGAGNSSLVLNYEWVDPNSHPGVSYYRLKQIDFDGSFSYSDVRAVEGIAFDADMTLLPNPTRDVLTVQFGQLNVKSANIRIYAIDGKLIYQQEFPLSQQQSIALPITRDLPAGNYLLQAVFDNGNSLTKKFVKYQ